MHSKLRYEICIFSVIPGEIESFSGWIQKYLVFFLLRKIKWPEEWNVKNQTPQNRREFIRWALKILHEWNGHLEIFSPPQGIKSSKQNLRLRTDILQKTVVGCPGITTTNYEC